MKYILSVAVIFCAVVILCDPAAAAESVGNAVSACLEVIIPSLFAFTVLAVYLQESGLYRTAMKPLTLPLSKLLRLDEELCAVLVLSNIGGYPVGAKLLCSLAEQGRLSKKNAGRLLCCCYGSGPSFVISIAGVRVFGSVAVGAVIFAACFISSLIIALVICRSGERIVLTGGKARYDLSAKSFISSVTGGARVMFTVCAVIVGFSAVNAVLEISGADEIAEKLLGLIGAGKNSGTIFPALLEISRLRELKSVGREVIPLAAALLSFGGVCVVMQVSALTEGRLPLKGFLLSRIPAAAISAVLSCAAMLLPDTAVEVSAPAVSRLFSVNAGMSLCLLVMCGMLIGTAESGRS